MRHPLIKDLEPGNLVDLGGYSGVSVPTVSITFLLTDVDVAKSQVTFQLSEFMSAEDVERYFKRSVPSVTVTLYGLNQSGGYTSALTVPPSGRLDANGAFVSTSSITTLLDGSFSRYPRDSYAVSFMIDSAVDGQKFAGTQVSGNVSAQLADRRVRAYYSQDAGGVLGFDVERRLDSVLYVYMVALTPLLLIVAVIIRSRREDRAAVLELAIGAVALVPLRQVLVPTSGPGLTDVDVLLGSQFVLIIGVAALFLLRPAPLDMKLVNRAARPAEARPTEADFPGDGEPLVERKP